MVTRKVPIRCILLLSLNFYFLRSLTFCEVIENPKWKNSKLYSSLLEGKIKLPYYIPPNTPSGSSSSSIYFPPPGGARPPQQPSYPNYSSRNNYSSIPESPSWMPPPSRYPQPPRDDNPYPDASAGGNNRPSNSGSGTSYPSYPPSSNPNPSNPSNPSLNNPPIRGPPQEPPRWPPGPQPQPSPPGSGKYPKPTNPMNPLPSPEDSNHSQTQESSGEESSVETITPGKPSMAKPKPSNTTSGGKNSSSPSKSSDTATSSGGKFDPVNATTSKPANESETDSTTESTDGAGANSTVTCTSTKAENHKIDFPYVWKIEGFFDYARASEKFKDPFVFKLKNLNLHPDELPGNWSMTLAQQNAIFNHTTWALNITYETEDDSKTYIEVHLDAKVGRKTFNYPAVTTNHSSFRILTGVESDGETGGKGITMHSYLALWADIKYDKHGESIVQASTSQVPLELNFTFETVIVHKLVNSSNC